MTFQDGHFCGGRKGDKVWGEIKKKGFKKKKEKKSKQEQSPEEGEQTLLKS